MSKNLNYSNFNIISKFEKNFNKQCLQQQQFDSNYNNKNTFSILIQIKFLL